MCNEIIINLIQCLYLVLDTVTDDRTMLGISNVKKEPSVHNNIYMVGLPG
jgi:hypothetical protein